MLVHLLIWPADGNLQNDIVPHTESALILGILDEVRRQGGYNLPEDTERVQ